MQPLNSEFNRDFQIRLLRHLYWDETFYREKGHLMSHEDFELPACKVIFEALQRYVRQCGRRPIFESLEAMVVSVINNYDGSTPFVVSQNDNEAIFQVLQGLTIQAPLDTDFYRSKIQSYLITVRTYKVSTDLLTSGSPWQGEDVIQKMLEIRERTALANSIVIDSMTGNPTPVMNRTMMAKIKTGITPLDSALMGGLGANEMGLIVGITGLGKTNTLVNFQYAATMSGIATLFITLELTDLQIKQRWACIAAHVEGKWVHSPFPEWPEPERERCNLLWSPANHKLRYDSIYAPPRGTRVTVDTLSDVIGRWKEEKVKSGFKPEDCRGVYVDWLDCIDSTGLYTHRNAREDMILTTLSARLSQLARKHDVALWTATQAKAQAAGAAYLGMQHTAQSFHKLDAVDVAIGISEKENKSSMSAVAKSQQLNPGAQKQLYAVETRRVLAGSVMKNRSNPAGARFDFYQGPTLRYFDSEHDAGSIDNMIKQNKIVEALGLSV